MNDDQIGQLLQGMAARDRRTCGVADVIAWVEDIGDLKYADAHEAMKRHYATSDDWLMAKHIRAGVKAIREDRLKRNPLPDPPFGIAEDARAYLDWLRDTTEQIADGTLVTEHDVKPAVNQMRPELRELLGSFGRIPEPGPEEPGSL